MTKAAKTTKATKKTKANKAPKAPLVPKKSVYDVVTSQVIEMLEAGVCPWRKPWVNHSPFNGVSKRPYHGLNTMLLGMTSYTDPRWFSYKQAVAKGGQVRADEKGRPVVFWTFREVENETTGEKETIPVLRYYTVFNAEQIDGLDLPSLDVNHDEPLDVAQEIVDGFMAAQKELALVHGGNRACYSPRHDTITMPGRGQFVTVESYYSTLFHEMGHATGHKNRLGRFEAEQAAAHGDEETYAKEELVAEMVAAFLNNEAGTAHELEATVSYLAGWITALKGDSRLLIQAAGKARKACNLILGIVPEAAKVEVGVGVEIAVGSGSPATAA